MVGNELRLCDVMLGDGVRIVFCVCLSVNANGPTLTRWINSERGHVVCVQDAVEARIRHYVPQ